MNDMDSIQQNLTPYEVMYKEMYNLPLLENELKQIQANIQESKKREIEEEHLSWRKQLPYAMPLEQRTRISEALRQYYERKRAAMFS